MAIHAEFEINVNRRHPVTLNVPRLKTETTNSMRIRLSIAARNRMFSRAARRVRPFIDRTLDRISETELENPTWTTVLLGIVDDLPPKRIDTIPNDDCLQLMTGFPILDDLTPANDAAILAAFIAQIRLAIHQCGLTPSDTRLLCGILSDVNCDG